MADDPTYIYDVFISYSPADREWAEDWLRPRLEQASLHVCSDEDFEPGVPKLINIERAVGNSHKTLLVLSPAWVESEWSEFAALLSQTSDPAAHQRRLLPLMLQPCHVPPRIGMLTSIDFTRTDKRDKEIQRAIKVMRGELRLPERPLNQEQRNRQRMLQKVRDFWVKGVLENSLHGAALIELGMEYKPDAVQHPWDMVIQQLDQPSRLIPFGTKIIEVFDELGGELLVLGAPGSGKTTILLELARDLIVRAEQEETYPLPVVFNMSSWAEKRKALVEWLVDELNIKYDVPRRIGKTWVDAEQMLLLLDGLDEVKQEYRSLCAEKINQFRQEHGLVNVVVCSRIADYEVLTTPLKLQGAILIQPLAAQQIDTFLKSVGNQLATLRAALVHDAALRELTESPLILSVMAIAYQGLTAQTLPTLGSVEEQRRHLFDVYVKRMFARPIIGIQYTVQQSMNWLYWLARGMIWHSQSAFYLEYLQPTWMEARQRRLFDRIATISGAILVGLIGGLGTWIAASLVYGQEIGLRMGLSVGIINGVAGALITGYGIGQAGYSRGIQPIETIQWSWSVMKKEAGKRIGLELVCRLGYALVCGLGYGLSAEMIAGPAVGWRVGLGVVVAVGLVVSLLMLSFGLHSTIVEVHASPNQGIRQSLNNAVVVGIGAGLISSIGVGLAVGLGVGLNGGLVAVFVTWLVGGLVGGLTAGGTACIRHLVLRFILWRNGSIPLNYVRFLDTATARILLYKSGGGYIFIHRLLMEYFASLDTSEQDRNTPAARETTTL